MPTDPPSGTKSDSDRIRNTFEVPHYREELGPRLAALAAKGVFIGTSSWKYEGWLGQLYSASRYEYRGRVATARFDRHCLKEYAETFHTVCVDAAYYSWPTEGFLASLAEQVHNGFRIAFKVTDSITVKHFPNLARFGARAGQPNPDFLNADIFKERFLGPLDRIRPKVGLLIFEFSQFYTKDYDRGRDFVGALDGFLGQLPNAWSYGVEIRNKSFLQPEYFDSLRRHNVTHVFNSWTRMPSLREQIVLPDCMPACGVAARLLLRPGRTYEQAKKTFQPYDRVQDDYPEGRTAAVELIARAQRRGLPWVYMYVNNRFEGHALTTIQRILDELATRDTIHDTP